MTKAASRRTKALKSTASDTPTAPVPLATSVQAGIPHIGIDQFRSRRLEINQSANSQERKVAIAELEHSAAVLRHHYSQYKDGVSRISFMGPVTPSHQVREKAIDLASKLLSLGMYFTRENEPRRSLDALEESLAVWTALDAELAMAYCQERMIDSYVILGREEEAFFPAQRALALYQKHGERRGEIATLNTLALVYKKLGNLALSQEMLHQCLHYLEETQNQNHIALISLNIANNYTILEDAPKAIEFATRGVQMLEQLGQKAKLPEALGVLGTAHLKQGELDTAALYLERGVRIAEQNGINWATALLLSDLGNLRILQSRFEEACETLQCAITLFRQEEAGGNLHRAGLKEALSRMGFLYANEEFAKHDDETALSFLIQALNQAEETDRTSLASIYEALVSVSERLGRLVDALHYSRALREAERRLFNEESDKRIRSLQIRFDVSQLQKDAEIAHLRSVELANALAETETLRRQAEEYARTDALTGVANRRYLNERLRVTFEQAQCEGQSISVALIDIDNFKRINDTMGHAVGDAVLQRMGAFLRNVCRPERDELVARYGGEEFCWILPQSALDEAAQRCERLRQSIEAESWTAIDPGLEQVTISIGVAEEQTHPHNSHISHVSVETLSEAKLSEEISKRVAAVLKSADSRLYIAKRGGRNRVRFHDA